MSSPSVDFLVIGGGPAGCAFAILAARAGASVVLVERDDYQQVRPGEHLAGRVRPMLDALRVPRGDARGLAALSPGILSTWSSDESALKCYGTTGQASGLCVIRHRFDELLCRSAVIAGATVVSRGKPVGIERLPTHMWEVTIADPRGRTHKMLVRSIVDASGRRASLARARGARRINHGDLVAIVRWFEIGDPPPREGAMLTVESSPHGWWSLSVVADRTLVATLYTSTSMAKTAGMTPQSLYAQAFGATRRIARIVSGCRPALQGTRVYRACPSRSSRLCGDGWIAIGDAAVAFDPLAGQGVALAFETAFRAFEAAMVDPSWSLLGADYQDALLSRFDEHLARRARVYEEAGAVLPRSFLRSAVLAHAS